MIVLIKKLSRLEEGIQYLLKRPQTCNSPVRADKLLPCRVEELTVVGCVSTVSPKSNISHIPIMRCAVYAVCAGAGLFIWQHAALSFCLPFTWTVLSIYVLDNVYAVYAGAGLSI